MTRIAVKEAKFVRSFDRWKVDNSIPALPQVCFAGRSNVGKSSLLNSLVARRSLARTSRTPGRTQLINMFDLALKADDATVLMHLIDLPGYGYANAPEAVRQGWKPMMAGYLRKNPLLKMALLLLDIRHAPSEADFDFMELLDEAEVPTMLVATKADKVGKTQRRKHMKVIAEALGVEVGDIVPYSAETGEGREELLEQLVELATTPLIEPDAQ
jgi:GTP-binding protein